MSNANDLPTITLFRSRRNKIIEHRCYICDCSTLTIAKATNERTCDRTDECKETKSFGIKSMFAHTVFATPVTFEGQLYIFNVKPKDEERFAEAFPDAILHNESPFGMDNLPFKTVVQKKKSTWYCFDCPCNNGETKTFKSNAGLYNHKKKCPGSPDWN